MLPIPFEKFIPSFFTRDSKLTALSNRIDNHLDEWKYEILNLNFIIDPPRIPSFLLNDIGDYLDAGFLSTDSDRTKRQKIANAVSTHKLRGTWKFDVKPTIDAIIGDDAQLSGSSGDSSDFIILGGEASDPDYYWGTLGIDGIDDELGVDIVGEGNELVLAGVFLIDVGIGANSLLSKDTSIGETKVTSDGLTKVSYTVDIDALKFALEDKIPDYFRVYLGYTDNNGIFRYFENGQIN